MNVKSLISPVLIAHVVAEKWIWQPWIVSCNKREFFEIWDDAGGMERLAVIDG